MLSIAEHGVTEPPAIDLVDVVAQELRPHVRAIDEQGVYPERVLRLLGAAGSYGHHIADGTGGLAGAIADMATVGEVCGSTAFCVWCQDALAWYLDRSPNRTLASRVLPSIATGRVLGGTGLSNPMKSFSGIEPLALKGERVPGGYRVSGRLPWVSNLGPQHFFASIFSVGETRRVMALFDCAAEGLSLVQNAKFIALEGTRTFSVFLRDVFIPDEVVIAEDAATFVPAIRQGFVLLQFGMALGAARGIADAMEADPSARVAAAWLPLQPAAIRERTEHLFDRARDLARAAADPSRAAFLNVLRLRLEASWLALEAAQAFTLQAGARGYLKGADADRRRREAQFIAIVTPSIKHISRELAAD